MQILFNVLKGHKLIINNENNTTQNKKPMPPFGWVFTSLSG